MELEEKIKTCRKLARSFRRSDLYEDLVSEGLLEWLEHEARGYDSIPDLVLVSKKKMQDFISLRQGPLTIPPSDKTRDNARAIRKGQEGPLDHMANNTYGNLRHALEGSTELIEGSEGSYEGATEEMIWVNQVSNIMKAKLKDRDYQIFLLRYGPEGLTAKEVATALKISPRAVQYADQRIKRKLAMLK